MSVIDWVVSRLSGISSFFYDIYLECYYSFYIPNTIASLFYSVSSFFNSLAWDFYYFGQWVDSTASKLLEILSYSNIYSYFKAYFDYAIWAWDWVLNAWSNVTNIINSWWYSTGFIVQSWIDIAKQALQLQLDNLMGLWLNLQVAWDDFKTRIPSIDEALAFFTNWWAFILVPLTSWWGERVKDVQGLINSAFLLRQSYWEGWQDIRDSVFEFFTDPLGWLEARFTDWFLGPEE